MKTRLLRSLLVSFLVSSPVFAQITITTTDVQNWYAVGKGQRELQKDQDTAKYTMNVGNASTSLSQTWTLPSVAYTDTMLIKNASPSSTPHASKFPMATHAQTVSVSDSVSLFEYYGYIRIANDSLIQLGSAFHQKYGTVDTTIFDLVSQFLVKMPVALGTVITERDSNYYGPGDYEIRNSTETFDAFGSIMLPNGTFQCLRSKSAEFYQKAQVGQPLDTFTVYSFNWITKEGHQGSAKAWRNDQTSGSIQVEEVRYTALVSVPTGVAEEQATPPNTFALMQNYPNPFNPSTTIRYALPSAGWVRVSIHDILGREIAILVDEEQQAGWKEVRWDATGTASGIYFYRMTIGSLVETKKMLLVR